MSYAFKIGDRVVTNDAGPATITDRFPPMMWQRKNPRPTYYVTVDEPTDGTPADKRGYYQDELAAVAS